MLPIIKKTCALCLFLGLSFNAYSEVCLVDKVSNKCTPSGQYFYNNMNNSKLHALIIGIANYTDPNITLAGASNEALSINNIIKSQSNPKGDIKLLNTSESTTKQSILTALDEMSSTVDKEDIFVFYYSGHGVNNSSDSYIISSDTDTASYSNSGISASLLMTKLSDIPAQNKLILLDTEYAHLFFSNIDSIADNILVINATSGNSRAFSGTDGSVFTHSVIDAFSGKADKNDDGILNNFELASFIEKDVRETTHYRQRPSYSTVGSRLYFNIVPR